jgi:hypothetical protein
MLNITSTGTPAGMSSTLMVAICERRFALAAGKTPEPVPKLPPESEKPNALLVGSGLHAGLAGWYAGKVTHADLDEIAWYGESIEQSHPINCREIRRLLRWYFVNNFPTEFGKVLHIEIDIALPRTDEELPGFTGAIDLIVECGDENVQRLAEEGCYLPGPGVYGVDHKTASSASKAAQMEYSLRPQFAGYCLISPVPLKGFIINRIMKTQTVKRALYYVPPPDEQAKLMVSSLVRERLRILQNPPEYAKANPDACLDKYGGLCPYLFKGCNRY